jgi:hypothetical protein
VKEAQKMFYPMRLVDLGTIRNWGVLDIDTGQDVAEEIREYYIPDFSNWRDEASYSKALKKLIDDLRVRR